MIKTPIFSQRDPQWKNYKMGGGGTIGKYGCTITCIASLASYFGNSQTPLSVNKLDIYAANSNYVSWAKMASALRLKFIKRVYSYNNIEVAFNVYVKRVPVLVEVDSTPIGVPGGRHWVLFVGDRMCFDPWTGSITPTSKWKPTGYALLAKV